MKIFSWLKKKEKRSMIVPLILDIRNENIQSLCLEVEKSDKGITVVILPRTSYDKKKNVLIVPTEQLLVAKIDSVVNV